MFKKLDLRRRKLKMSYAILAKRSGVSMPTVVRILGGDSPHSSYENVAAIAAALGFSVELEENLGVNEVRERQARQKAQRLVGMVQGTSGLEGQALSGSEVADLTQQTFYELLSGSGRDLWSD